MRWPPPLSFCSFLGRRDLLVLAGVVWHVGVSWELSLVTSQANVDGFSWFSRLGWCCGVAIYAACQLAMLSVLMTNSGAWGCLFLFDRLIYILELDVVFSLMSCWSSVTSLHVLSFWSVSLPCHCHESTESFIIWIVIIKRSRRVFFGGCSASRCFSEVLAFRSSDSQSLNQGHTRRSRLSTMSALKRRKPWANKSNKWQVHNSTSSTSIWEQPHLRNVTWWDWGRPLASPLSETSWKNFLRLHHSAQETPTMLAKTFRQMTAHNKISRRFFCAWFQNLWKPLKVSEILWEPLKVSEILWKPLKASATKTSRR